jgi:glyoxylase-like metal-dependent hydrolase (beta-lactamase superfamily II)
MRPAASSYHAYGLELARWTRFKASDWFFRYEVYGADDLPKPASSYVWLLRNDTRTVLVDCGVSRESAAARGLVMDRDIRDLLAQAGVDPARVDHVVLSHLHFDHTGNIGMFPNATFSVSRAELDFWTGPFGRQPALAAPVEDSELAQVVDLLRDERLVLIDDELEILPGIRTRRVGGHTPGQTITTVNLGSSRIVLAGDAVHFYEEMRQDRLYRVFTDALEMLRTYEHLRELDARPDTIVVSGHDPEVMGMFEPVAEGCVDLAVPVGDTGRG